MSGAEHRNVARDGADAKFGGLGAAYQVFGDALPKLLEELNERLAA
jgi:hypothetical protein